MPSVICGVAAVGSISLLSWVLVGIGGFFGFVLGQCVPVVYGVRNARHWFARIMIQKTGDTVVMRLKKQRRG